MLLEEGGFVITNVKRIDAMRNRVTRLDPKRNAELAAECASELRESVSTAQDALPTGIRGTINLMRRHLLGHGMTDGLSFAWKLEPTVIGVLALVAAAVTFGQPVSVAAEAPALEVDLRDAGDDSVGSELIVVSAAAGPAAAAPDEGQVPEESAEFGAAQAPPPEPRVPQTAKPQPKSPPNDSSGSGSPPGGGDSKSSPSRGVPPETFKGDTPPGGGQLPPVRDTTVKLHAQYVRPGAPSNQGLPTPGHPHIGGAGSPCAPKTGRPC